MDYKINCYKNTVYEILNFLSEEEHKHFLTLINNSIEEDWPSEIKNEFENQEQHGTVLLIDKAKEKNNEIYFQIYQRLIELFDNPGRVNNISAIQRYKPGKGMHLHVDNKLDSSVLYGIVIYLNDDYKGGEIFYPKLNLKIKPKAKSIIIHPASTEHEVLKVKGEKTRYIISSFVRGTKTTRFKYGE